MMSHKSISAISVITDSILEKVKCPEYLRDQMKLLIKKGLETSAENLEEMVRDQLELGIVPDEILANISHMIEYLTACFRQRNLELSSKESKDEDSSQGDIHIEAIKRLSSVLTRDLRITETLVLDNLVQSKALSETGRQSIIKGGKHHSINAAFLKFCNSLSCSEFKGKVLPALRNSNDDVNSKLATDIQAEIDGLSTCQNNYSLCGSCRIRHTVNYRRLADQLYKMKVISDNEKEDLSSYYLSNESKWKQLLDIQKPHIIAMAIKVKCPGLYRLIRLSPENVMTCTCWKVMDADIEEDVETDSASDVARISDISSITNTTYPETINNFGNNINHHCNLNYHCHNHHYPFLLTVPSPSPVLLPVLSPPPSPLSVPSQSPVPLSVPNWYPQSHPIYIIRSVPSSATLSVYSPASAPAPAPMYSSEPFPMYSPPPTPAPLPVISPSPAPLSVYSPSPAPLSVYSPVPAPLPVYSPAQLSVYSPSPASTPAPLPVNSLAPLPVYSPSPAPTAMGQNNIHSKKSKTWKYRHSNWKYDHSKIWKGHISKLGNVWKCLEMFGNVWICLDLFGFVGYIDDFTSASYFCSPMWLSCSDRFQSGFAQATDTDNSIFHQKLTYPLPVFAEAIMHKCRNCN